ncbi:hypothetical protein A2U01_0002356 [Trifolium medium]|uniref:Uncharacterized protein n=1 Tax=Trifolium medium TaxID=97028 RepID=A0A392M2S3_9FABA|nr:hypothetical protein [Trifolium medium]
MLQQVVGKYSWKWEYDLGVDEEMVVVCSVLQNGYGKMGEESSEVCGMVGEGGDVDMKENMGWG